MTGCLGIHGRYGNDSGLVSNCQLTSRRNDDFLRAFWMIVKYPGLPYPFMSDLERSRVYRWVVIKLYLVKNHTKIVGYTAVCPLGSSSSSRRNIIFSSTKKTEGTWHSPRRVLLCKYPHAESPFVSVEVCFDHIKYDKAHIIPSTI